MRFREGLVLVVVGLCVSALGFRLYQAERQTTATPDAVTIDALEKGPPKNPYVTIDEHQVFYQAVVLDIDESGELRAVYYPIYSVEHMNGVIASLARAHKGDYNAVTNEELTAAFVPKVVVKTHVYKTIADIQMAVAHQAIPTSPMTGLVLNATHDLSAHERAMLKAKMPNYDADVTLLFEEGRKPSSPPLAVGLIGSGGVLCLFGLLGLLGVALPSKRE